MTGFNSKRQMAADKSQENVPLYVSKTAFRSWSEFASDYDRGFIDGMQKQSASFSNGRRWGKTSLIGLLEKRMPMARIKELEAQLAQPAQEPVAFESFLESQDFYELMQTYRHCLTDALLPFEEVKDALRAAHIGSKP